MKYSIVIPTFNGGQLWKLVSKAIYELVQSESKPPEVIIIDSSSTDDTVDVARNYGFKIYSIEKKDFNHGATRNYGAKLTASDIIIFLTQDAIPQASSFSKIKSIFENSNIALAYGRQLPHDNAGIIAIHARQFNYPPKSYIRNIHDSSSHGIKTVFISNSFSAYRADIFKKLGGFPQNVILCEDMFYAANAVSKGYEIAYVSEACVKHSHNYSAVEEFRRYFDIGVFHQSNPWILKKFGSIKGEGKKFILSEINYIAKTRSYRLIINVFINSLCKYTGFILGKYNKHIPRSLKIKLSMHKGYWYDKD